LKVKNLYFQITTNKEYLTFLILFLKKHSLTKFETLLDIISIYNIKKKKRFALFFNLLSLEFNTRVFVKIKFLEVSKILTISSIFYSAN